MHKNIYVSKFTSTKTSNIDKSPNHNQKGKRLKLDQATAINVEQFPTMSNCVCFEEGEPLNEESGKYLISAKRVNYSIEVRCERRQVKPPNSEEYTDRNKSKPFFALKINRTLTKANETA